MSAPTEKHRKALSCLEELANMPLGISLEDWSRLSAPILEALKASEDQYKRGLERAAEIAHPPLMHRKGNVGLWRQRRKAIADEILSEITASAPFSSRASEAGSSFSSSGDPAPIHDEASK